MFVIKLKSTTVLPAGQTCSSTSTEKLVAHVSIPSIDKMTNLPKGSPFSHKVVVSTIAVVVGILGGWQTAKDFQFIKYEPRTPEEIERRKRENIGLEIRHLETRTLDYTPEAKARLAKKFAEKQESLEKEGSEKSSDRV